MPPAGRVSVYVPILVAVLVFVFFLQAFRASLIKSPVFDEPIHIVAGLSYLKTREFKINLQHPPLLKEIGALPLLILGVRWPMTDQAWAAIGDVQDARFRWQLESKIIFGSDPDRIMFWSRLPFALLGALLGYLIYAWGRRLLGQTAALGALFLYAFDPTMIGHAYLVTTDVGFAVFGFLFLFCLWLYLNYRSPGRLLWCGLSLGAALASKFAAIFLLPIAAVLVFWATRWIRVPAPARGSPLTDPYAFEAGGRRIVRCACALLAMGLLATILIEALYFFPRDPFLYIKGMGRLYYDHDPTYLPFMAGTFQQRFLSYYLVATLVKEPVASIVLIAFGLLALIRRGSVTVMDRAFILLPPAGLFVVNTLWSHDLGIRYVIPALPFLHLAGGAGLAALLREEKSLGKVAAVGCAAWVTVAAIGIYPDHLSYFNEAACVLQDPEQMGVDGGTRCGPLWLDDSNVDWGQGLKQLKEWLKIHAPDRAVRFAYFGSVNPNSYGLSLERIDLADLMRLPSPGLYVLSGHYVARGIGELRKHYLDGPGNWLLHIRPTAVVGHAYYVYDIPEPG